MSPLPPIIKLEFDWFATEAGELVREYTVGMEYPKFGECSHIEWPAKRGEPYRVYFESGYIHEIFHPHTVFRGVEPFIKKHGDTEQSDKDQRSKGHKADGK